MTSDTHVQISSCTLNVDGQPVRLHCGIAVEHVPQVPAFTDAEPATKESFTVNVDGPKPVRLHGAILVEHVPQDRPIQDAEPAPSKDAEPAIDAEPAPNTYAEPAPSNDAEPAIDAEPAPTTDAEPAPKRLRSWCYVDGRYHSLLLVVQKSFAYILADGQYLISAQSIWTVEQVYDALVAGRVKPEMRDVERFRAQLSEPRLFRF